jgi:glycosyltransferase involved in cell wall biosynthesis
LTDCLEALTAQEYPRFEIVVIDNDPQGSAGGLVRRQFPAVRYCAEDQRGVRFARNRGVAEASGDIIAFIDDDCLPVPGWLSAIAGNFRQRPQLGCCTGPVLPAALDTPAQEWLEQRGGFNRGFVRRVHTSDSGRQRWRSWPLQTWMFGSGGNMAFRRSVLQQIGTFDQVLSTAEDLDIFFRVLHAGYELAYEPAAAVRHIHVSSYPALRRRLYLWGWGYIAYLLKVACEQPDYRQRALAEIAAWFPYQVRDRLWPQLRRRPNDFPLGLILIEIAGGLAAIPSYLWRRTTDRRRPATPPLPVWK